MRSPGTERSGGTAALDQQPTVVEPVEVGVSPQVRPSRPAPHEKVGVGTLVAVRLQPDLLARLDRARGGLTRPALVREILERELP